MTIINHECYISLEVAKLLKKAGFDWECETCYIGKSGRPYKYHKFFNWNMPRKYFEKYGSDNLFHAFISQKKTNSFISAPTLEVAQRWLREVKNCYVGVEEFVHNLDKNNIYYTYNWVVYLDGDRHSGSDYDNTHYYEVALETSIKKALELILEG